MKLADHTPVAGISLALLSCINLLGFVVSDFSLSFREQAITLINTLRGVSWQNLGFRVFSYESTPIGEQP
jgi:hypothetical protein